MGFVEERWKLLTCGSQNERIWGEEEEEQQQQQDWVDIKVHVDTVSVKEFVRNPKLPCAAAPTTSS